MANEENEIWQCYVFHRRRVERTIRLLLSLLRSDHNILMSFRPPRNTPFSHTVYAALSLLMLAASWIGQMAIQVRCYSSRLFPPFFFLSFFFILCLFCVVRKRAYVGRTGPRDRTCHLILKCVIYFCCHCSSPRSLRPRPLTLYFLSTSPRIHTYSFKFCLLLDVVRVCVVYFYFYC